jgi:TIR domain
MSNYTFLCHNNQDKVTIEAINKILKKYGVKTWLDKLDLKLGIKWEDYIIENISQFDYILIFLGPSGLGRTQELEILNVIKRFQMNKKGIVPVLLDGFHENKHLFPEYITYDIVASYYCIDLQNEAVEPLKKLISEITNCSESEINISKGDLKDIPHKKAYLNDNILFFTTWIIMHIIGVIAVNSLTLGSFETSTKHLFIPITTLIILLVLVNSGLRQLTKRSIPISKIGFVIGLILGALSSYIIIRLTNTLDEISAIAGVGSSAALAAIAGATCGSLWGAIGALIGASGALVAAMVIPTQRALIQEQGGIGLSMIVMWITGTLFWSFLLCFSLTKLMQNRLKIIKLFK